MTYKDLIQRIAEQEPCTSYREAHQLPNFTAEQRCVILEACGLDCVDSMDLDPVRLARLSADSEILGAYVRTQLDAALKRWIYDDVRAACDELDLKDQRRFAHLPVQIYVAKS